MRLFQSALPVSLTRMSSSIAPDQFFAAICARTAESLSGAGAGTSSAKAWPVANSSALVARKRVMAVFMVWILVVGCDTVIGVYPALTRPDPERMQRGRENYQSLTQCPDRTNSPEGLPPGLAGAASMLTASRGTS